MVWTYMYASVGYASYIVHRDGGGAAARIPLAIYALKTGLNWLYTPLFFGAQTLGLVSGVTYQIL